MNYPLCIFLGILPSIIWLVYYLRKDVNPEPRLQVIKIFLWGMMAALPAIFIQKGFFESIKKFSFSPPLILILNTFLGVALVEETIKYLVVRGKMLDHPDFDESIDAMMYMIIAALGFAALENILVMIQLGSSVFLTQAVVLVLRFWGATLLHALCSAVVGFFLALSFLQYKEEKFRLIGSGLLIATFLHGLFNFFIIKMGEGFFVHLISIFILMVSLAIFVILGLKKLKKLTI